jgi:hypothetical protein
MAGFVSLQRHFVYRGCGEQAIGKVGDLSKCIVTAAKLNLAQNHRLVSLLIKPVVHSGIFVAQLRLAEKPPAIVRTNEASGEITRWT